MFKSVKLCFKSTIDIHFSAEASIIKDKMSVCSAFGEVDHFGGKKCIMSWVKQEFLDDGEVKIQRKEQIKKREAVNKIAPKYIQITFIETGKHLPHDEGKLLLDQFGEFWLYYLLLDY
jgi:hypothetical protein